MLQGFGTGAGKDEKKPGEARPFFPFGSPPFRCAPKGLPARSGALMGLMLKR